MTQHCTRDSNISASCATTSRTGANRLKKVASNFSSHAAPPQRTPRDLATTSAKHVGYGHHGAASPISTSPHNDDVFHAELTDTTTPNPDNYREMLAPRSLYTKSTGDVPATRTLPRSRQHETKPPPPIPRRVSPTHDHQQCSSSSSTPPPPAPSSSKTTTVIQSSVVCYEKEIDEPNEKVHRTKKVRLISIVTATLSENPSLLTPRIAESPLIGSIFGAAMTGIQKIASVPILSVDDKRSSKPPPPLPRKPISTNHALPSTAGMLPVDADYKDFILVILPDKKERVRVQPGRTICQVLSSRLNYRDKTPFYCQVFLLEDKSNNLNAAGQNEIGATRQPVPWDTDSAQLGGKAVIVERLPSDNDSCDGKPTNVKELLDGYNRVTHELTDVSPNDAAFECSSSSELCCGCSKAVYRGYKCRQCSLRVHGDCADKMPKSCLMNGEAPETAIKRRRSNSMLAKTQATVYALDRSTLVQWAILDDDIHDLQQVGSGSFGVVYKARWHGDVAMKKLKVANPTEEQRKNFINEVLVLKYARHPNIVLFMGCVLTPYLAIVTEWCPDSSLYKKLHVDDVPLDNNQIFGIAEQTILGMEYLHSRSIIHRDLKSHNILLAENLTVKIADMGLSIMMKDAVRTGNSDKSAARGAPPQRAQLLGTTQWMAPEILNPKRIAGGGAPQLHDPYSEKSDVYAFGVVQYELWSGQLPYAGVAQHAIMLGVGSGRLKPDMKLLNRKCPVAMRNILLTCIKSERTERPTFRELQKQCADMIDELPRSSRAMTDDWLHRASVVLSCTTTSRIPMAPLSKLVVQNLKQRFGQHLVAADNISFKPPPVTAETAQTDDAAPVTTIVQPALEYKARSSCNGDDPVTETEISSNKNNINDAEDVLLATTLVTSATFCEMQTIKTRPPASEEQELARHSSQEPTNPECGSMVQQIRAQYEQRIAAARAEISVTY